MGGFTEMCPKPQKWVSVHELPRPLVNKQNKINIHRIFKYNKPESWDEDINKSKKKDLTKTYLQIFSQ